MPTQLDDTIIAQRGILSAAGGNDTYILSPALVDANAEITITDTQTSGGGRNQIQLIEGLSITSSIVAADTAQLNLSNGAVITIFGASSFSYEVGGDPLKGTPGSEQSYQEFVQNTLGTQVPTQGVNNGGPLTIGDSQGGSTIDINADADGVVIATDIPETFLFEPASGNFELRNFDTAEDLLRLDLDTASTATSLADLNGTSLGNGDTVTVQVNQITGDTLVTFGLDNQGELISIELAGVSDPSSVDISVV